MFDIKLHRYCSSIPFGTATETDVAASFMKLNVRRSTWKAARHRRRARCCLARRRDLRVQHVSARTNSPNPTKLPGLASSSNVCSRPTNRARVAKASSARLRRMAARNLRLQGHQGLQTSTKQGQKTHRL